MSQTMKVKKGDTVQVLRGKDAGKKGRVLEALPKEGRVVVENINVVKRHRRPRPIQNTTGMGGPSIVPGGIIELPPEAKPRAALRAIGLERFAPPLQSVRLVYRAVGIAALNAGPRG